MPARLALGLSRLLRAAAAGLVLVALAGATYQGVATSLERRAFPRPGRLVDAGGHQLHINCQGEGSPTVVLEAAAGSMSAAWGWIQPELAVETRVCSYDRSGLGWSHAGDGGYSPARIPDELHLLLTNAHETGPFVIVGHELGATFASMFSTRFGGDTAALVLVRESGQAPGRGYVRAWPWLARTGLLRAAGTLSSLAEELPGESGGAVLAFLNRPDHLARAARELASVTEAEEIRLALGANASVPVTELSTTSRGRPALLLTRAQAEPILRAIRRTLQDTVAMHPTQP